MMKKLLLNLILFFTLVSQALSLSAAFVHGEIWRKWSNELKAYQHFYFLGDIHINMCADYLDKETMDKAERQNSAFLKNIKSLDKKSTIFLYENPCWEDGKPNQNIMPRNEFLCSYPISENGFNTVSCENRTILEYFLRYCDLLPNTNTKFYESYFKNDFNKKVRDASIYRFIEKFENQISSLINNNKNLKVKLNKYLNDFNNNSLIRTIKANKNDSFTNLVTRLKNQAQKNIYTIDDILQIIEINLFDLLEKNKDKSKIITVIGARHIGNIRETLTKMGYTKICSYGLKEYEQFKNSSDKNFCTELKKLLEKAADASFYESFFKEIIRFA